MADKLTSLTGFGEGDPKPEKKDASNDKRFNAKKHTPGVKPTRDSEYFGRSYAQLQRESRSASAKSKALSKKSANLRVHPPTKGSTGKGYYGNF